MIRATADEAAALVRPVDTLGMPLGPGQPPALLEALGRRTDWVELRIGGALLTVLTDLFSHPGVHYLSGFFGPLERLLRDSGANLGFAPADFRRFGPILDAAPPRVMCTAAAPPDATGWCSLSLHSGATVGQLEEAAADPDRLLVVEVSDRFPRTYGGGGYRHALSLDSIDVLVESDSAPITTEDPPPTDVDRAIAAHVRAFVPNGATLQTGIGAVPSMVATLLAEGDGGGYGIHSEMFTTGLMRLHQAGKVANHKPQLEGLSVATFAAGSRELYDWLHENHEVAFLPVEAVNAPELIAANPAMVTINAAMAVDIQGQVIADTIDGVQYSGIGGHEDFVAGPALAARGPVAPVPAVDGHHRRRGALADRALVRRRGRDHHASPPGRHRRHGVRRRRAAGQDRAPAGRGAGRHRTPRLPRRPARRGRTRQRRTLAQTRPLTTVRP